MGGGAQFCQRWAARRWRPRLCGRRPPARHGDRARPACPDHGDQAGRATPLGRVRDAHTADIGRALDLGCEGVIVPNVESAEQAAAVASACRYPPDGHRSAGGALATQSRPLCIVMVESRAAMDELPATLAVAGVDGIYVGPRDLSLSLGCPLDPHDPVLRPAFERIWADCAAAGKPVGVHATDGSTARLYREQGCRLVTVISDSMAISRATKAELAVALPAVSARAGRPGAPLASPTLRRHTGMPTSAQPGR